MPYLVRGTAQQLATYFNAEWICAPADTAMNDLIEKDLPQSFFLGSTQDAEYHLKTWRSVTETSTYNQGDMLGNNLFYLLNKNYLFKKETESFEEYQKQYETLSFAYVN